VKNEMAYLQNPQNPKKNLIIPPQTLARGCAVLGSVSMN